MMLDVLVIGGSFAGLSAAMQLARAQKNVTVVDAGQPRNRFASHSHGFFGLDGITPQRIREQSYEQLRAYPNALIVQSQVTGIEKTPDGFVAELTSGQSINSKIVILATGLRDEIPDIAGLRERWGQTVIHCPYCHGYEMRNQPLGVIATSQLSTHQAIMLPDWGPTHYFTQGQFEPDEEQLHMLNKRKVSIERTPIIEVLGNSPLISHVRLQDGREIAVNGLFVGPKTHMSSPLAEQLGCEFDDLPNGKVIKIDAFNQTSVEGVFAAGDIANPLQNATLASASGVLAGVGAHQALIHS